MNYIFYIILPLTGLILGWIIRWLYARFQLSSSEQKADRIIKEALRDAEVQKKEVLLEAKDQLLREKNQLERETRIRRNELQRQERRVLYKEESLEKRLFTLEKQEKLITNRERSLKENEEEVLKEQEKWKKELEKVSELTTEEAKEILIKSLEKEAHKDAESIIQRIEDDAREEADRKSKEIILSAIQRIATDVSSQVTVTTVSLPNDEMKGRIIGREGRNIRTLETLTGVDVIIDDTPEVVVISCFDAIRKEIAKISLERLIIDGRIHPARIEEVVNKVRQEVENTIVEQGEKVLFEIGIHNMSSEAVMAIGRLYYKISHGQNVLTHSKEVALLAGAIASEIGADVDEAKRAAILHDIGKGVESNGDKNHIEAGMELARKLGEKPVIINAIAAHNGSKKSDSITAVLVQIANSISGARPGARKEALEAYTKRLEGMEKIANSFDSVTNSYAVQAGRELRVIVNTEAIDDIEARNLSKNIAKKIETELQYPGKIKITIIRETRVIEYAR